MRAKNAAISILRAAILLCAFFSYSESSAKTISSFNLNTGEIIIGEVVRRDSDTVEVKNAYATIKIPASIIVTENLVGIPEQTTVLAGDDPKKFQATEGSQISADQEWRPFFESKMNFIDKDNVLEKYLLESGEDYKDFIHGIMPENMKINLRAGISNETTSSKTDSYYFYASIFHEWSSMSLKTEGFYNYVWQRLPTGAESVTTDKYGLSTDYKWHFLGEDSDWYFTDVISYRHDTIKLINRQIDESIGVGYEIKMPEYGLRWSVSLGPGTRYIDAEDFDRHLIPMAFLNEELKWDLTKLLRLEHQGYFGADLQTGTQGTAYVMIGLVFAPEGVVNIAFRLTNDYDAINSSNAIKNEQKFILSVEVPIEGISTKKEN